MNKIFSKGTLREHWEKYSDSEQYLKTWYDTAMNADWKTPNSVKQTYGYTGHIVPLKPAILCHCFQQ